MILTVNENKNFYICADIEAVDKARRYQLFLGWTETSAFGGYVNKNIMINCNTTMDDINRAEHICGEAAPIIQGKKRRKKPTVHSKTDKMSLPLKISERHKPTPLHGQSLHKLIDILTH